ncbi:MAG: hypothetical protein ACLUMK_11310 [Christensenellales bacterium]
MKNLLAYDFTTNTIVASKATLKKGRQPTTPEYKALDEDDCRAAHVQSC